MNYEKNVVTYGTGFLLSLIVSIILTILGDPLFENNSYFLFFNFMQSYMLPLFFVYGILLGEFLFELINTPIDPIKKIYFIELLIITLLASTRGPVGFFFILPISGHSLIISFYILSELFNTENVSKTKIFIGILVLILTIYVKIIVNDLFTFISGLITGTSIFLIGYYFKFKEKSQKQQ